MKYSALGTFCLKRRGQHFCPLVTPASVAVIWGTLSLPGCMPLSKAKASPLLVMRFRYQVIGMKWIHGLNCAVFPLPMTDSHLTGCFSSF